MILLLFLAHSRSLAPICQVEILYAGRNSNKLGVQDTEGIQASYSQLAFFLFPSRYQSVRSISDPKLFPSGWTSNAQICGLGEKGSTDKPAEASLQSSQIIGDQKGESFVRALSGMRDAGSNLAVMYDRDTNTTNQAVWQPLCAACNDGCSYTGISHASRRFRRGSSPLSPYPSVLYCLLRGQHSCRLQCCMRQCLARWLSHCSS